MRIFNILGVSILILAMAIGCAGTSMTVEYCDKEGKNCLQCDFHQHQPTVLIEKESRGDVDESKDVVFLKE